MNRIITTLLLALGISSAQAQVANPIVKNPERRAKIKALLAPQQQQSRAAAKTTATYWRLRATSTYQLSGISLDVFDSNAYAYSNGRGSQFQLSSDLFIDDYGLSTGLSYDTVLKFRNQGSGLELRNRYYCSYDGNNRKAKFTDQSPQGTGFSNNTQIVAGRDGNGNLVTETQLDWTGSAWDTSSVTVHTYNSQNKPLVDSTYDVSGGMTDPSYLVKYTYDGNGNMTQSVALYWNGTDWDSSSRTTNTYYSSNALQTTIDEDYDTSWVYTYKDSMGYGVSTDFYIYDLSSEWDTANAVWVQTGLETRTVNGSGLPGTVAFAQWNDTTSAWEPTADADIVYDGNQNVTNVIAYGYIGGFKFPTPVFQTNFYYEFYFKTGINDASAGNNVKCYPNPAATQLNVVTEGRKDARILLTGMTGQVVRTQQANSAVAVINVAGLPPGNYILTVESADAAPARQIVTIQ